MSKHTHYAVFDLVARNKRILIVGPKGAGKSLLVNKIKEEFSVPIEVGNYLMLEDLFHAYTPAARDGRINWALNGNKGYLVVKEPDVFFPEDIPFDYIVGVEEINHKGIYQYTIIDAKVLY